MRYAEVSARPLGVALIAVWTRPDTVKFCPDDTGGTGHLQSGRSPTATSLMNAVRRSGWGRSPTMNGT